jgi:ROK family
VLTNTLPDAQLDGRDSPTNGACRLEGVSVDSYSLALEDAQGLVGDRASETAFRDILKDWQLTLEQAGSTPFGVQAAEEMSKDELDRIAAQGDTEAARTVALAVGDFAAHLAYVIGRFLRQGSWAGVERIVIGGGFKESAIGRLAVRLAQQRLAAQGVQVGLRTIHHHADDAGLIGWARLHPHGVPEQAFLAVDIGGTNVRCGIVAPGRAQEETHVDEPRVIKREKWRHADNGAPQADLVEGIVDMLRRLMVHAGEHRIPLLPFIGIGCPGVIRSDGSIARGAQNLPGDWDRASFHLPRRISENIPKIDKAETLVLMHNDAVVQGLSELAFTRDVRRWAALTIGTGLGNASFTNQAVRSA